MKVFQHPSFRFLLFFIGVLFLCGQVSGQVRLGIIGGPASASVTETNSITGWSSSTQPFYSNKNGIHFGLIGEIPLSANNRLFLQPAIMYMPRGRKFYKVYNPDAVIGDTFSVTQTLTSNYIDIPLNIAYKLPLTRKGNVSLLLSAGPYVSFLYNGNFLSEVRTYNDSLQLILDGHQSNLEAGKAQGKYKTADYGYHLRGGLDFGGVSITGFLSQGLGNFYQASYSGTFKHKVYGASLVIWLAKQQVKKAPVVVAKPLDTDMDGVADVDDLCPTVAGVVAMHGCPMDTDKDGVADAQDKCPSISGLAKYEGCPIPDTDSDSVNDEEDSCRTVAGIAKYHGCPIPDKDGDGVNDDIDGCPDVAGTVANHGCPEVSQEIKKTVDEHATAILFKSGSDQLATPSFTEIKKIADLLKADTSLHVNIAGHTDVSGTPAGNLVLSSKRAAAVKAAFEKYGVDGSRIESKGYGDTQPIADNATPEGRKKNRRVELKLSY